MIDRLRWSTALAMVPLWPIVWLIGYAVLARMKLGFWPRYDQPDPKGLNWPFLQNGLDYLLGATLFAVPASVALSFRRRDWSRVLLMLASFAVLFLWFCLDPGGLFEWWLD